MMDDEQSSPDNAVLPTAAQDAIKPGPIPEIVSYEGGNADVGANEISAPQAAQNFSALSLLNAEELTVESNVDEANRILAEGRIGLSDATRGTLVAGRAYTKLKPMFPKGKWLPWLKVESIRVGHSIRSIQDYMLAARKADAKNASPCNHSTLPAPHSMKSTATCKASHINAR